MYEGQAFLLSCMLVTAPVCHWEMSTLNLDASRNILNIVVTELVSHEDMSELKAAALLNAKMSEQRKHISFTKIQWQCKKKEQILVDQES